MAHNQSELHVLTRKFQINPHYFYRFQTKYEMNPAPSTLTSSSVDIYGAMLGLYYAL